MKHIINAYDIGADNHGLDTRYSSFTINARHEMTTEDVIDAIRKASTEYCQTEEGRKVYSGNCHNFNIGDFDAYVTNELCQKYGIQKVESNTASYFMDFNEQLVNETDILEEE